MKRTLSVGMTAATFMMTVALAAQAPTQQPNSAPPPAPTQRPDSAAPQAPPSQQSQPSQRTESAAGKITLNGCIEKADSQQASAAVGFVLTNAATGSASSTSGGGAVGTTGAAKPASSAAGTTYRLDADAEKLTPHVGHQVEIVGTPAPAMADSSAARPADPAASRPAASATPSLKVESIKMLAQTCSSK